MELLKYDPKTQWTLLSQLSLQLLSKNIPLLSLLLKINSEFLISFKGKKRLNSLLLVILSVDRLSICPHYVLNDLTIRTTINRPLQLLLQLLQLLTPNIIISNAHLHQLLPTQPAARQCQP